MTACSDIYAVPRWGEGYFHINDLGHLGVRPDPNRGTEVDLAFLSQRFQHEGLSLPVLVRFNDILRHRVRALHGAFQRASLEAGYQGGYTPVYPNHRIGPRHDRAPRGAHHQGHRPRGRPADSPPGCAGERPEEPLLQQMARNLARADDHPSLEVYESAQELYAEVRRAFERGAVNLTIRARAEDLFLSTCRSLPPRLEGGARRQRELLDLINAHTGNGPRSVCLGQGCNRYSAHAKLMQGAAETTTTQTLVAGTIGAAALRTALEPLEVAGSVYLLGTLTAPLLSAAPPVVTRSGDLVTLWYATPPVLEVLGEATLRAVDLRVQVRHPPSLTVPELAPAPAGTAGVHALLQRWLNLR